MWYSEKRDLLDKAYNDQFKKKDDDEDKDSPVSAGYSGYVKDFDDSKVIVCKDGDHFQIGYTMDNKNKATFDGEDKWEQVTVRIEYEPEGDVEVDEKDPEYKKEKEKVMEDMR